MYTKTKEEVAKEQVCTRGKFGTSIKRPLEAAIEKEVESLAQALEESKKIFQAEEEIWKAEELQLRTTMTLSQEKTLQARMEVSPTKGPKAVVVGADDGNMLEVNDVLPLRAVILRATSLLRLKGALKASKSSLKVVHSEAIFAKGPKATSTKMKDVPTKGPTAQSRKKMT
ncbi:hypothetical protein ACLOJK_011267 [Asimina triloba]